MCMTAPIVKTVSLAWPACNTPPGCAALPAPCRSRELDMFDAQEYLEEVRIRFLHAPHIFSSFVDVLKQCRAQT